jgi:hypothetical protein
MSRTHFVKVSFQINHVDRFELVHPHPTLVSHRLAALLFSLVLRIYGLWGWVVIIRAAHESQYEGPCILCR